MEIYVDESQKVVEACKNCLLTETDCKVTCRECENNAVTCDECSDRGFTSTERMKRKCFNCQVNNLDCFRLQEISWVSDSEAAQRSYMFTIESNDLKVPIPDPPLVLKLVRSGLFNYWTIHGNNFISLKMLDRAREDANEAISKPIAQALPRSCLRNRDKMNMGTAVALFKGSLLNVLPDNPVVTTLVPEQDRFWRQNPAKSVLKYPTAVPFSAKYSLVIIADKAKSTIFMEHA